MFVSICFSPVLQSKMVTLAVSFHLLYTCLQSVKTPHCCQFSSYVPALKQESMGLPATCQPSYSGTCGLQCLISPAVRQMATWSVRRPSWCPWVGGVVVVGGGTGGGGGGWLLGAYGEWQLSAPHEMATYISTITNQLQGWGTSCNESGHED